MWSRIGGEDRKRSAHARSATKSLTRFGLYLTCENGERAGERGPPWDGEIEISRGSPCVHSFSRDFCQPGLVPHGWRWLVACSLWLANSRASCTALRLSDKQIYRINWNTPPGLITRGVPILNFGPGGIKNDGGLTPFKRNLLLNMQCDP